MLNEEFPVPLEKWMTRIAILAILVGSVLIAFVGWKIVGGVIVAYGILTLFLAYHMGAAPCLEELDKDVYAVKIEEGSLAPGEETGELQPEWLTEPNVRNMAN